MRSTLLNTITQIKKKQLQKIKVLIVDDQRLTREGLRALLEKRNDQFHFLAEEAKNSEIAIAKVKRSHFDLVIMEYYLPKKNGAEITQAMLAMKPKMAVLGLSNYYEKTYIVNILEAGAKGYILKNIDANELMKAITIIVNGGNYFSNEVALKLINYDSLHTKKTSLKKQLCEREVNILKMIAQAHTSRQIADKLYLSKRTIDKYRGQLLKKMQVRNTAGLLLQAKKLKLIE